MKTEKLGLTVFGLVVLVWVVRMILGIVTLARHQEVALGFVAFELSMFLGAGLIPVLIVWFGRNRRRRLIALWAPCIFYVVGLAANLTTTRPLAGSLRLLLWLAIIVLLVRHRPTAADSKGTVPAPQTGG